MSTHNDVADRFRYFLESTGLDRDAFVAAVDGAISATSLYSVLNGHRRPSRALAVLIEHQWGFRANYLLAGQAPVWRAARGRLTPDRLSADEQAVLEVMSRSADIARAVRRDLDDTVLWADLWQRTQTLLASIDSADVAHRVFDDCVQTSRQFQALLDCKGRRRFTHLVVSFIAHCRRLGVAGNLEDAQAITREARWQEEEQALRSALHARLGTPAPADARVALEQRIADATVV
ncbi:MAG: hypothetical protein H6993_18500 [Pseudomonadales bacterium]|nr:hypothetical protein [Pseudomonadales bacterium]MCP5185963.1 hypothetical protein [Pseudomonadales bacterium]